VIAPRAKEDAHNETRDVGQLMTTCRTAMLQILCNISRVDELLSFV